MPTFNARLHDDDPITYEAIGSIVKGGTIVVPAAGTTTDPSLQGMAPCAVDAALNVLGVAEHDAVPVSLQSTYQSGTEAWDTGYTNFDASVPGPTSTVYNDVVGNLTTSTACANGDKICANATGGVRKALAADISAGAVIGSCVQPNGVSAGGTGLFRIRVV